MIAPDAGGATPYFAYGSTWSIRIDGRYVLPTGAVYTFYSRDGTRLDDGVHALAATALPNIDSVGITLHDRPTERPRHQSADHRHDDGARAQRRLQPERRFGMTTWRRHQRDDAGFAMIVAVLVMMLLTILPVIMFTEAIQQLPLARHDQDHESALHAAEAGIEDYINHLNADDNYATFGNSPTDGNLAFSSWVAVPGPTATESFRYAVDTTSTLSNGIVYVSASGRSCNGSLPTCPNANKVVRTIKVGLRKTGFLDYLYLTDYEIIDPALSGESTSRCLFHSWEKNSTTGGAPISVAAV